MSAAALISACEPARQMLVRDGQHPENIDENVRFRTTYYFRTFDYCYGKGILDHQASIVILPETDSLYRFRMTGKARALSDRVHFESGTLKASQIDPFGAKILYDESAGGFRFAAQEEVDAAVRRQAAREELDTLIEVLDRVKRFKTKENKTKYNELRDEIFDLMKISIGGLTTHGVVNGVAGQSQGAGKGPDGETLDTSAAATQLNAQVSALPPLEQTQFAQIRSRLATEVPTARESDLDISALSALQYLRGSIEEDDQRGEQIRAFSEGRVDDLSADVTVGMTAATEFLRAKSGSPGVDSISCPEDAPVRRGFQIMGPEGWRTFNQDERLIMAMSTSAKPLINVLQEYSDRLLNAKVDAAAQNLTLTQEHLRIVRAEREFDRIELVEGTEVENVFDKAIEQFKMEGN